MDGFSDLITWALQAVLSGSVIVAVAVMSKMRASVESLNVRVGQILEKLTWHEKTLDKHETRLTNLEYKELYNDTGSQ